MKKNCIHTIIIDDDKLFRFGLRHQIENEKDIDILGEAGEGELGLSLIRNQEPEVALVDFYMPDSLDKLDLIQRIKIETPLVKVVTLTREKNPFLLLRMIEVGSDAILVKKGDNFIIKAIHDVMLNHHIIDPEVSYDIIQAALERQKLLLLNPKEWIYFTYTAQNIDPEIIAEKLDIKTKTLKNLFYNIKSKLHLNGKDEISDLYQRYFSYDDPEMVQQWFSKHTKRKMN